MATYSLVNIGDADGSVKLATWANITEADVSLPEVELPEYGDRSVHIFGTFNGGGVSIQGRNSTAATAQTLVDPQGNPITKTAEALEQLLELTRYVKPKVTSGTGVDVTVVMILRRTSGMRT